MRAMNTTFEQFQQTALAEGDSFVLDANVPHAERYGPAGASYWVARKN